MNSTTDLVQSQRTKESEHQEALNLATAPQEDWRRFALHFLFALIAVLLGVAALNFFTNPKGLYPTSAHVPAFGSGRDLKPALLKNEAEKPKILILGSSRCRLVKPSLVEQITGMHTFNASVESATTDDYLAILHDALAQGQTPKAMIICLDVEAFLDHDESSANDSEQPSDQTSASTGRKLSELVSWDQTMLSIESVFPGLGNVVDNSGTSFNAKGETTFQRTLQPEFSKEKSYATQENLILYAALYRNSRISARKLEALHTLLEESGSHGVRSIVLLTPLSSEFQSALRPYGWEQKRQALLEKIEPLCAQAGARFLDLTFPYDFGGNSTDFYDGVHLSQGGADRMTRQISGSLISALH